MSFETLNVRPEIVRALTEMEITTPTLIQEKAIPLIKAGKDVIGMSETGSGKTVAFGVPILENIKHRQGLQAMIVVPTRELAVQISQELRKFSKYAPRSVASVFGGVSLTPQFEAIEKAEILVGTPGRILDHLQRRTLNLSKVDCVVLDEADKMADMGFIDDIRKILNCTARNRQMLLFGATISREIDKLKHQYMHEPAVAKAETQVKPELLAQYFYNIPQQEKFSLLVHLLRKERVKRSIIFCSARTTVEVLTNNLRSQGIDADMIHGTLSQNRRLEVIDMFNKGKLGILVASAVASRGLDIKDVTHVFNYDLSQDPQEYIHRIGRTARAGEAGKAITLLGPRDHDAFREILYRFNLKVPQLPRENFPKLRFESPNIRSRSRFQGRREGRGRNFNRPGRFHRNSRPSYGTNMSG
ncbi:MAG: DEAD/DEAH box helicase [Nanoarchaeota archaeon]|nr:DEAD/DEAH box helicase [Nanoarchaeota archaeon]